MSPKLIYNANTGFALDAKDLIPAQFEKAARGYESNAVGTYKTSQSAQTKIKQDEKGIWYNFKGQDGQFHHAAYFFAEQMENPEKFTEFATQNFKQPQRLANETIKIDSSEIIDYLGAYVAASKSGANIAVTPEVATQFKQNMLAVCDNELKWSNAERNPNIPKLNDILFSADKKAGEIVKSIEKERGISPERKQKQKPQEHKRNQGMER